MGLNQKCYVDSWAVLKIKCDKIREMHENCGKLIFVPWTLFLNLKFWIVYWKTSWFVNMFLILSNTCSILSRSICFIMQLFRLLDTLNYFHFLCPDWPLETLKNANTMAAQRWLSGRAFAPLARGPGSNLEPRHTYKSGFTLLSNIVFI